MAEFVRARRPDVQLCIPQLPSYPQQAAEHLHKVLAGFSDRRIGLVGSSLGGYLATWLMEYCRLDARAVLINPAVRPYQLLHDYLGQQQNPYTGEVFTLTESHMGELKALEADRLSHAADYWVLLQQGDEVLDAHQAEQKYRDCRLTVEPGGDHSFQGFDRFLPAIVDFLFD